MNCEICTFDSSVDSVMWKCTGCPRAFHATCVGVTVQRNSLRRKDKKVDINSYLLPCCDACQELLQSKLEFNQLIVQQKLLTEQLHANTEVTHRFAKQQETSSMVHEAIEGLEVLLIGIKNELSAINKTSSLAGSVASIKNHVTSLFDTAMTATKDSVSTSLKTVTSDLSTDLRNINNEINQLNQLSLDIASSCTMSTNSILELDILDELKSLSANIVSTRSALPLPSSSAACPSLEVEFNDNDESGWRLLGTRKVWKRDWTEYDARKLRRSNQQKQAEKARRRRKQHKAKNNNVMHYKENKINALNYNLNATKSYQNNHTDRHNISGNYNYNPNNNRNLNLMGNRCNNTALPSDRVLLAAAKNHFSGPSTNYRPTIQFQRGETLNPYPVDYLPRSTQHINPMTTECSPKVLCEACCSQNLTFRRY